MKGICSGPARIAATITLMAHGPAQHLGRMRALNVQNALEILDCSADALIGMDVNGRVTEWNRAAEAMFGWSHTEAVGRTVSELIIPAGYRDAHERRFRHFLATGEGRTLGQPCEVTALNRSGREFSVELTRWSLASGADTRLYAFARDVTERKRREQRERALWQQAYHDKLTGLSNRELLVDRLGQLLARRDFADHGAAVLFVDLDRFKRINDSLGHAAGDRVLMAVAERLRAALRPMDTAARISGDEFVVVCPEVRRYRDAAAVAQRIQTGLAPPIRVKSDSVFVTASVGVVIAKQGDDAESLLGAADATMYHAKISGRDQYALYDERFRGETASRLRLENELREAIERDQLVVHYQAIVDAESTQTVAVEALVRWQHPSRGLLLPDTFIPMAEETGLIVPMGEWVLRDVCRHAREWEGVIGSGVPLRVSINLSARQLAQSDLVSKLRAVMASARVDPNEVEFGIEVTESAVMRDPTVAAERLQELRATGAKISIDDFGTGYSSLAYLKHLPVDTLKVDRSFITNIARDTPDLPIVRAIATLAHTLGLSVVAEGVETEAQASAVRSAGVDLIQGFLYARPKPLAQHTRVAAMCG